MGPNGGNPGVAVRINIRAPPWLPSGPSPALLANRHAPPGLRCNRRTMSTSNHQAPQVRLRGLKGQEPARSTAHDLDAIRSMVERRNSIAADVGRIAEQHANLSRQLRSLRAAQPERCHRRQRGAAVAELIAERNAVARMSNEAIGLLAALDVELAALWLPVGNPPYAYPMETGALQRGFAGKVGLDTPQMLTARACDDYRAARGDAGTNRTGRGASRSTAPSATFSQVEQKK